MREIQGTIQQVMRVEYRRRAGPGVDKNSQLQAIAWVKRNGTVLRQDVFVGGSELRFERQQKAKLRKLAANFSLGKFVRGARLLCQRKVQMRPTHNLQSQETIAKANNCLFSVKRLILLKKPQILVNAI